MDSKKLLKKTQLVIITTVLTMILEIYFGFTTHSMALLADGFHMGTHAFALLITLFVCYLAIKFNNNEEKFNALGGYTSAILLGFTAIAIMVESIKRFFDPLSISFSEAIIVAVVGLLVNAVCILIMGDDHSDHICEHHHHEEHADEEHKENLNYKAAYFHILADALTSILAIGALLLGKYFGLVLLDPLIGLAGAFLIGKWAIDLLKKSGKILLDL